MLIKKFAFEKYVAARCKSYRYVVVT